MTYCRRGLISKSNLRTTKFSATRLPTSCGDAPAGQSAKEDCGVVVWQPTVSARAIAAREVRHFEIIRIVIDGSEYFEVTAPGSIQFELSSAGIGANAAGKLAVGKGTFNLQRGTEG